eukprot:TRINITY_DN24033_c0_g1_i2.p1 TRINITY_DN24033_c0_g1~~TRINITY_DN24033_c0_g1_i2.p1  ORF type:complete len:230 (+),score=16.98 TRINITY_DN24033_c0_g1_i2:84-692(+)
MANVFVYGTLMSDQIARGVIGVLPPRHPAVLKGYTRYRVRDASFPAIVAEEGGQVKGMMFTGINDAQLVSLDKYEGIAVEASAVDDCCEYNRAEVEVETPMGVMTAFAYVWKPEFRDQLEDVEWSFEDFMHKDFSTFWGEELEGQQYHQYDQRQWKASARRPEAVFDTPVIMQSSYEQRGQGRAYFAAFHVHFQPCLIAFCG